MANEYVSFDELKYINFQLTEVGNKITGVSKDINGFLYIVYDKNTKIIDSIKYDGHFLDVTKENIQFLNLLYSNKHQEDSTTEKHTIDELSNIELYLKEENGKIIGFNFSVHRLDIICDKQTGIIESIRIDNKAIKITQGNIHFLENIFPLNKNTLDSNSKQI